MDQTDTSSHRVLAIGFRSTLDDARFSALQPAQIKKDLDIPRGTTHLLINADTGVVSVEERQKYKEYAGYRGVRPVNILVINEDAVCGPLTRWLGVNSSNGRGLAKRNEHELPTQFIKRIAPQSGDLNTVVEALFEQIPGAITRSEIRQQLLNLHRSSHYPHWFRNVNRKLSKKPPKNQIILRS